MSQKGARRTQDPCPRCFLHRERCICAEIPRLEVRTRLLLIAHYRELKRTTNTGRLAVEALANAKLLRRGEREQPLDLASELSGFESILLYPSDDAIEIADFRASTKLPLQLIVPDGNWRQASKVAVRHPELKGLVRVKVTPRRIFTKDLRREHTEYGMATLPAIALAYEALEGRETGERLMALYAAKLKATLEGRGVTVSRL